MRAHQDVELIKVAVHEAQVREARHQIHQLPVHDARAVQLPHLTKAMFVSEGASRRNDMCSGSARNNKHDSVSESIGEQPLFAKPHSKV